MSLEDAMNNLASAMNRYADVIEKNGVQVVSVADTSAAAPKDKKPAGRPPKAAAESKKDDTGLDDDDDGLGGEEEPTYTIDDVKGKLVALRNQTGDKDASLKIMKEFGYAKVGDIKEKDFAKIIAKVDKMLD